MSTPRKAGAQDAALLADILQAAYAPFLDLLGADAPPLQQDIASDIADGACLVIGDPPLGFAVFRMSHDAVHLENLAVDPRAQGRGTGRALVAAVEAEGRRNGAARVTLATSPDLKGTRRFYGRLGYNETDADATRVHLEKTP